MNTLERSIRKLNKNLNLKSEHLLGNHSPRKLFTKKNEKNSLLGHQYKAISTNGFNSTLDISENSSVKSEEIIFTDNRTDASTDHSTEHSIVGLSYLPLQMQRQFLKKAFHFTLMVVGQSGLGKSTLINSMFFSNIYSDQYPGPSKRASKTLSVESHTVLLEENSISMKLTIVDTPGFGVSLDNRECWKPLVGYIDKQNEEYLHNEMQVRRVMVDHRVHCCLYFIPPTGHVLSSIDIKCMQHLQGKVNIIPVIGKADCFTADELISFKKTIMDQLSQNKINVYSFPDHSDVEDQDGDYDQLKSRFPFAIVSSNYIEEMNGQRKRVRKYPWGTVDIEDLSHCDFKALRNLLIKHCICDLIECTHTIHYENYRAEHHKSFMPIDNNTIKH